jgi:hypothetical protein
MTTQTKALYMKDGKLTIDLHLERYTGGGRRTRRVETDTLVDHSACSMLRVTQPDDHRFPLKLK